MLENSKKRRSRKCKLVPRQFKDYDVDEVIHSLPQANNDFCIKAEDNNLKMDRTITQKQNSLVKLKMEVDESDTAFIKECVTVPPPIKFSVKVEIEECEEDMDMAKESEQILQPAVIPSVSSVQATLKEIATRRKHGSYSINSHCIITDTAIRSELEKLSLEDLSIADKKIFLEIQNSWGRKFTPLTKTWYDKKINQAMIDWRLWAGTPYKNRDVPLSYKCYICRRAWWDFTSFRQHVSGHDEKNISINLEFQGPESHIVAHDMDNQPSPQRIPAAGNCWKCGNDYAYHIKQIPYNCSMCKLNFNTCYDHKAHEASCRKALSNIVSEILTDVSCEICGLICFSCEELDEHLHTRHSVRSDIPGFSQPPSLCINCNDYYIMTSYHMCSVKVDTSFCSFCYRKFPSRNFVDLHMFVEKRNVRCRVCNDVLPKQCVMVEHMVTHSNLFVIMYKCLLCSDTYFDSEFKARAHRQKYHKKLCKLSKKRVYDVAFIPISLLDNSTKSTSSQACKITEQKIEPIQQNEVREIKVEATTSYSLLEEYSRLIKEEDSDDDKLQICIKEEPLDCEEFNHESDGKDYENILSKVFQASKCSTGIRAEEVEIKQEIKEEPEEYYEDDIIILNSSNNPLQSEQSSTNSDINMTDLEPEVILESEKGKRIYHCKKCNYKGYHREYKLHIQHACESRLLKKQPKTYSYPCTKCGTKFTTLLQYIQHFTELFCGLQVQSCPQCLVNFKTVYRLAPHLNMHVKRLFQQLHTISDAKTASLSPKPVFQCTICKINLPNKLFAHWEHHLTLGHFKVNKNVKQIENTVKEGAKDETALEPKILKEMLDLLISSETSNKYSITAKTCIICSRYFQRLNDAKRHFIEHLLQDACANIIRYGHLKCQICSEKFRKPDRYKYHMRNHASLPVYMCELCDKAFSDSSNFTKHKKVHNLQVYICDICQKKFQAKASIEKHLEIHKKWKPMPCEHCNKVFYESSFYRRHVRQQHDRGAPRFKCFCNMKFDCLKDKWDHMWTKHKIRKRKADCPLCDMSFRKYIDVKRHVREEHGMNIGLKAPDFNAIQLNSEDELDVEETLVVYDDMK